MLANFRKILFVLCAVLGMTLQSSATPRTVFVQLFEWPWQDIAKECEIYLGPAGFSAVQISPPHEHVKIGSSSPWWERYQVVSYKINSRSGDESEFIDMVRRCKKAGVDIYADAVFNHMTGFPSGIGFAGTPFQQYNYQGLYSIQDFHHCGRNGNDEIKNYKDRYEVQTCELVGLADLATDTDYVRTKIADYLNHLLDLGVAGFRIDGAKHIPARDLAAIYAKIKKSPYIFHEVIFDPNGPIKYEEYTPFGDVLAFSYPYSLAYAFKNKNTGVLLSAAQGLPSSDHSIVSMTNHDLERMSMNDVLSFNHGDQRLYRLAQVFMLAWPYGYPQVFSGFQFNLYDDGPPLTANLRSHPVMDGNHNCFAPWTCEHRLPEVAAMVSFRNHTNTQFFYNNWWSNGKDQLAFGRGNSGYIAINFSDHKLHKEFLTSLPRGEYCNILSPTYNLADKTCSEPIAVNEKGVVSMTMEPMSAFALLKNSPFKLGSK